MQLLRNMESDLYAAGHRDENTTQKLEDGEEEVSEIDVKFQLLDVWTRGSSDLQKRLEVKGGELRSAMSALTSNESGSKREK